MLSIASVNKQFDTPSGRVVALKDISLQIPDGQFVCLLGPSGCGTSTTIGSMRGTSGQVGRR